MLPVNATRRSWKWPASGRMTIAALLVLGLLWCTSLAQEPAATPAKPAATPNKPAANPVTPSTAQAQQPAKPQGGSTAPAGQAATKPAAEPSPSATVATTQNQGTQKPAAAAPVDPKFSDLWVLLPAGVAIFLAIATRQVVPSLFLGLLVGAYMMVPRLSQTSPFASDWAVIAGFRLTVEKYILDSALLNADHMKIIVFTLMIGFTVGVIGANGGTAGMVHIVAGNTQSRRRGAITAWIAGLVVFFDDYANTMIVGPTMQPVFDKVKLSRAKLAYIVDSTAAPVASLALIGTWVGSEISFINEGLAKVHASAAPAFLVGDGGQVVNGMTAFVQSLPYRFYPILALFLVLVLALTGRDFGPMWKSESRALSKIDPPKVPTGSSGGSAGDAPPVPRWWLGLIPIAVLVGVTMIVLAVSGYTASDTAAAMAQANPDGSLVWAKLPLWERLGVILSNASSYNSILYGAFLSAIVAMVLTIFARAGGIRKAADAGLDGMTRMFPAIVILILAWSLSDVQKGLTVGKIVTDHLIHAGFPVVWLPLSVFAAAALISFATGSSWTTMGVMCPAVVGIAVQMLGPNSGVDVGHARHLFFAAIGSVLAGSVFGDHCSPISDTTVLSSIASDCPHEEHVWTQIPYALVAAVASMGLGDALCSGYNHPWYVGLLAGAAFLTVFVYIVGRRPRADFALAKEEPPVAPA